MDALLLSNSTNRGLGMLEHARQELADVLGSRSRVLFVPWALSDHEGYTARVREALDPLGIEVEGLSSDADPYPVLAKAEALFVGGGNTFRLLRDLHRAGIVERIADLVHDGVPYIGASAGTNLAAASPRTTNDMPIVIPGSFATLALLPFQINPHYVDADPSSTFMGETRERRIEEFLEENDVPVLGLREGAWLRLAGEGLHLGGTPGGKLFRRGAEPLEVAPGDDLSFLLWYRARYDVGAAS